MLEDPWNEPPEDMYEITRSPEAAPDKPTYIEIGFEQGLPVSLDGAAMDPVDLIYKLNEIGGENGIGREDLVENRLVGMKSHGVYETPGGTILVTAHKELESIVLDRDTLHYKDVVAQRFAELVYNGQWFTPLREAMSAFFDVTQQNMTGTVRLKLYKGNIIIAGRKSPYSLYREDFATFERGRSLQPGGRRRLHQPLRPADHRPGAPEAGAGIGQERQITHPFGASIGGGGLRPRRYFLPRRNLRAGCSFTHCDGMNAVPRDTYGVSMECWLQFGIGCIA